jgi:hypothetical protein
MSMHTIRERLLTWLPDPGQVDTILAKAAADGVTDAGAAALVKEEEWHAWGVPRIRARELAQALQGSAGGVSAQLGAAAALPAAAAPLLAQVPADGALLRLFREDTTLQVTPEDLASAARLSLAQRWGIEALEERVAARIEAWALEQEKPCPPLFYELEREIARSRHAGVLAAMDLPGTFVTEARQRALLSRLLDLWRGLQAFDQALTEWNGQWTARARHPHNFLQSLAQVIHQPQALAQAQADAPDAGPVLDAHQRLLRTLHRVYAGAGVVVARSLGEQLTRWTRLLQDPRLQPAIGAQDRDDMLRRLGVQIPAEAPRSEEAAIQYLLSAAGLADVPADRLPATLLALHELSARVPWTVLTQPPPMAPTRR